MTDVNDPDVTKEALEAESDNDDYDMEDAEEIEEDLADDLDDGVDDDDDDDDEIANDSGSDERLPDTMAVMKLRKYYSKLSVEEQEKYSQEEFNFRYLLSLSPTKIYKVADLTDPAILDRGLRLLFHKRYGQQDQFMKISPHIEYTHLPPEIASKINTKVRVEEEDLRSCLTFFESRRPTT